MGTQLFLLGQSTAGWCWKHREQTCLKEHEEVYRHLPWFHEMHKLCAATAERFLPGRVGCKVGAELG